MPGAASVHVVVPLARRNTPKSVDAYRSPDGASYATSFAGRSPKSYDRFVQVDCPVAGSMKIDETNLPGAAVVSSSRRVKLTELAGSASAFLEMTTRPFCAAAQS